MADWPPCNAAAGCGEGSDHVESDYFDIVHVVELAGHRSV